jgi:hypothetical protein
MKTILFFALATLLGLQQIYAQEKIDEQQPEKIKALFGGSLSIGYGQMTGNISDNIGNQFMLPLTGEILYKNLVFQLNLDAGFSKVKKTMEFPDGKSWNDGDNAWHNYFGGNIGYGIINNEKMLIAPYIGYAWGYVSEKWWGVSDIYEHEPDGNFINIGAYIDLKRKKIESGANTGKYAGYNGIRITIGAYIPTGDVKPYPELYNGSTIYFTVGLPAFSTLKK